MKLTPQRIEYILTHLSNHWETNTQISSLFIFEDTETIKTANHHHKIIFPLSSTDNINPITVNILNTEIPILFPLNTNITDLYTTDISGNLIFTHDYLKSSFYLLSGIQELNNTNRDQWNRFPFNSSIQKELNCITIPVVNYYFDIILQGLETFCHNNNLKFKRKRLFNNFGFFLTHDVDIISFFHWRNTAYKIKQLTGLAPLTYTKQLTIKLLFKGLLHLINPFPKKDPCWNFDEMINTEKKLGIRSAFYFLHNENRKTASNYKISDNKIKTLIKTLTENNFEVGIHGTIESASNNKAMSEQVQTFTNQLHETPCGIRQHFLSFSIPTTFIFQQKAGLKYDTSLSFAEHEGFRNGYTYPFKPYDFNKEKTINIWEIPLIFMEVTSLKYRNLNYYDIQQTLTNLILKKKKFGGIFTMLWHNSSLSEYEYPNIKTFYQTLLTEITNMNPTNITGKELIKTLNS